MKKILASLSVALLALFALTGCTQLAETAQKVSDDLGDSVHDGYALVDIWKVTGSDAAANGSPSGKKVTVIGKISSIPVVQHEGTKVLDYVEYEKTRTPAWYNSNNVTEVERLRWTSKDTAELQKSFLSKFGIVTETGTTAPASIDAAK